LRSVHRADAPWWSKKEHAMSFFGMGAWEITIILIAALVIFGPDRLPEMAGKIGKSIRDLRQMSSDLTGEFERTAGVQDLKKDVQGELTGVKSQVSSVTNSVKRDLDKAGSKVSSTVSSATASGSKTTGSSSKVSGAKAGSTSASKTAAASAKAAVVEVPKASKKDPLADVSFLEEIATSPSAPAKPAAAAKPASAAKAATKPATKSNGASDPTSLDQVDALTRARQRRQAAGYNRRPA
jgi:sec-independent protein translocase protein TatB